MEEAAVDKRVHVTANEQTRDTGTTQNQVRAGRRRRLDNDRNERQWFDERSWRLLIWKATRMRRHWLK